MSREDDYRINQACYNRLASYNDDFQAILALFALKILIDYGVIGVADRVEDRFEILDGFILDVETDQAIRQFVLDYMRESVKRRIS